MRRIAVSVVAMLMVGVVVYFVVTRLLPVPIPTLSEEDKRDLVQSPVKLLDAARDEDMDAVITQLWEKSADRQLLGHFQRAEPGTTAKLLEARGWRTVHLAVQKANGNSHVRICLLRPDSGLWRIVIMENTPHDADERKILRAGPLLRVAMVPITCKGERQYLPFVSEGNDGWKAMVAPPTYNESVFAPSDFYRTSPGDVKWVTLPVPVNAADGK